MKEAWGKVQHGLKRNNRGNMHRSKCRRHERGKSWPEPIKWGEQVNTPRLRKGSQLLKESEKPVN